MVLKFSSISDFKIPELVQGNYVGTSLFLWIAVIAGGQHPNKNGAVFPLCFPNIPRAQPRIRKSFQPTSWSRQKLRKLRRPQKPLRWRWQVAQGRQGDFGETPVTSPFPHKPF